MGLSEDWACYKEKLSEKVFRELLDEPGFKERFKKPVSVQVNAMNERIDPVIKGDRSVEAFRKDMVTLHVVPKTVTAAEFAIFVRIAHAAIDGESCIADKAGLKAVIKSLAWT